MSELIDREATVKQMCKMGEILNFHDRDVVIAIALFIQDDKTTFPTIERPHGEWMKEYLQIDEHHFRSYAKCKVCGCSFKPYSFAIKEFDFCPKCGADMREGDADDATRRVY